MSEEKKGYHKGALETLLKEKTELSKMLNIVNSLMKRHAQALKEAGVDVEEYINNLKEQQKKAAQSKSKKGKGEVRKRRSKGSGKGSDLDSMLEGRNKAEGPIKSTKANKNRKKEEKNKEKNEKSSEEGEGVDYSFK